MFDIPIITYHKISNQKEFGLTTVSQHQFEHQMKYLSDEGYETVCFKDIKTQNSVPEKPIIITFDDGYESIYQNALPVLEKYNFKSVIFVVSEFIGNYNLWEAVPFQQKYKHISKEHLTKILEKGHEIGSHSKNHFYLPALGKNTLKDEIAGSKNDLENIINGEVVSFCYPYGRSNIKIKNLVREAGYTFATSNAGRGNNNMDMLSLNRRSIYAHDSLRNFKSKVSPNTGFTLTYLSEILIQKGALASIGINLLRPSKSHF